MLSSPVMLQRLWDDKAEKEKLGDLWQDLGEDGVAMKNIMTNCLFQTVDAADWMLCTEDGLRAAYRKID
jgi:hypothetical protein